MAKPVTTEEAHRFYTAIETHVEMLVSPEMRTHAYASPEHDLSFQIFRLLSGYGEALEELAKYKKGDL